MTLATRPAGPLVAMTALALAASLAACGEMQTGAGQLDAPDGLPDPAGPRTAAGVATRPSEETAVAPFVQIANEAGAINPFRVWTYRTRDGAICLEIAGFMAATAACGANTEEALRRPIVTGKRGEMIVLGGTIMPAAVSVAITLEDGSTVRAGLIVPAPGVLDPSARLYVVPLPEGAAVPIRISVHDLSGAELSRTDI